MRTLPVVLISNFLLLSFAYAENIQYQLGIDGIACPFCVYGVEKQLSKLEGIERMELDIKKGLVLVSVKDGKALSKASIESAVNKAGFTLRSFSKAEKTE